MHFHEYQAKEVLKKYGVPVPESIVVSSVEEARASLVNLGWEKGIVKAQIHAGGRGKAGGVKQGNSLEEILEHVDRMLGMKIVNNQTGPEGMIVNQVMISTPIEIAKEFYLGAVIDRSEKKAMLIASPEGGMDIEEVAAEHPDKLVTIPISGTGKIRSFHLIKLAKVMGWEWQSKVFHTNPGIHIALSVAKAFLETDASLLEINPLVQTPSGDFFALDAKLTLDDNALFRQQDLAKEYDPTQISIYERQAKQHDLAYIAMDGNIGCMVNGAGLAMATMDIIKYYHGSPANFLDVGGSATTEKVSEGFKLILSDPKVRAILVNIFGGIMDCQTIAKGLIAVVGKEKMKVPLVVRMEGTNVEQGRKSLKDAQLNIIIASDLKDAAEKTVKAAKAGT